MCIVTGAFVQIDNSEKEAKVGSTYEFLGDRQETLDKSTELQQVPLLRHLSQDYLDGIARHAAELQAQPGEVLVQEGQPGRELMVIRDGTARVERNGQTLTTLTKGQYFGEISLLDGKARSATVVADSPVSYLALDKTMFDSVLDAEPRLVRTLLMNLCERIRSRPSTPVEEAL